MSDIEKIAAALTDIERNVCRALCGNSWHGVGEMTPGLKLMNDKEMIHLNVIKNIEGQIIRYKARPTPLGYAVRAHLENSNAE